MKNKGVVFGFSLSLLAGILLGATGGFLLFPIVFRPLPPTGPNDRDKPPPLPPDAIRKKIMKCLDREMALTDAQKPRVEAEVKIFADELGEFHEANREKLKSMFDAFKAKLAGSLSEEQAARLDKISGRVCDSSPSADRRRPRQRVDNADDDSERPRARGADNRRPREWDDNGDDDSRRPRARRAENRRPPPREDDAPDEDDRRPERKP